MKSKLLCKPIIFSFNTCCIFNTMSHLFPYSLLPPPPLPLLSLTPGSYTLWSVGHSFLRLCQDVLLEDAVYMASLYSYHWSCHVQGHTKKNKYQHTKVRYDISCHSNTFHRPHTIYHIRWDPEFRTGLYINRTYLMLH